jgi:hypothetical protein
MDKYRMAFGFLLLAVVAALAGVIAIRHVEEKTSYGLQILLGCFTTLAGGFAGWAFGSRKAE